MMTYEECKLKAQDVIKETSYTLNKAYELGNAYVFDDESVKTTGGALPVVINRETGERVNLWQFMLNSDSLTMDDMKEVEF